MLGLRNCLWEGGISFGLSSPSSAQNKQRVLTEGERGMQLPCFPGLTTAHRASPSVASTLQLQSNFFCCGAKTAPPSPPGLTLPNPSISPLAFPLPSSGPPVGAVPGAESSVLYLEFETQSIVTPLGSSEEESQVLEEEEKFEEEEEEEEVEDKALWAWPSEPGSLHPEATLPTESAPEESLSQASPPARAVLQPGASSPPYGEPEAPRPPRVLGPPTETPPTPREGNLASPPSSTLVGARDIGVDTGGPELSGVPRGESEETGSSEDAPSMLPATRAPEGTRELEIPSEEHSGRTVPAGTSVRAQPVLPTDSASRGGVAVAPSSGNCAQGSTSLFILLLFLPLQLRIT